MNRNIKPTCNISVEGLDKALGVARALIKAGYQVFIQDDTMDIYVISYAYNEEEYGAERFMLVSAEEEEYLEACRENKIDLACAKLPACDEVTEVAIDDIDEDDDDDEDKDVWFNDIND